MSPDTPQRGLKPELKRELAIAQDMLMKTAINAGHRHARIEAVQIERDAWRDGAKRLQTRMTRIA